MPNPDTPSWHDSNLTEHYKRRLEKDDACWKDILGITRSLGKNEYEQASYSAYESAILEYEAEERGNPRRICRVDKRTLKAITDLDRQVMITCYHEHYDRSHEKGSPSRSLVENTLTFLRALENRSSGKVITLYRIDLLKENIKNSKQRARKSPLVLLTAVLRRDHVKGSSGDASE
ncbi:hypothetical protein [Thiorhodococcus minor]|uniref:Uncharacterized protein n=1 Tax=Thiorhodococcus minor TaxID=57489 RepID=A0A6M0JTW0_9GAMM|nr:hypothetical protein [Thiorhodococcus minor]NEV60371.1 hypothetical protein [Thiorhodococcus minor]